MWTLTSNDLILPRRKKASHKGQNGRVLAVGGSERYVGALALAGLAAARAGADLVTVAAPEKIAWAINALTPDLITVKLPGKIIGLRHAARIEALARESDVLLIGNGLGRSPGTKRLVRRICRLPIKKVIDADALRAVDLRYVRNAILTPHKDELASLLENADLPSDIRELRRTLKPFLDENVIVLKGATDTVFGKETVRNTTGNAGMTRGGTGDVLAGLCAGFLAQQPLEQAARNAVYVNGRIGDILLRKKRGFSYLASDMVDEIERFSR